MSHPVLLCLESVVYDVTCVLQTEMIQRLSGGAQSGRAAAAEKALEAMKEEGLVEKPFVAKKRTFAYVLLQSLCMQVHVIGNFTEFPALFQ